MDNELESANNSPDAGQAKKSDQSKMSGQIKTTSEVGQALATAADFVFASAVLAGLGVWGGTKLDQWLHCAPWFTVGLALLGASLGMVRMVMKASATEKK
jgi:F0F1-type ATP synthase assembly protein I